MTELGNGEKNPFSSQDHDDCMLGGENFGELWTEKLKEVRDLPPHECLLVLGVLTLYLSVFLPLHHTTMYFP